MTVYTSLTKELCCPLCGDTAVQIDEVRLASAYATEITVSADGGLQKTPGAVPTGRSQTPMSGHRFALAGWCRDCSGSFALVFTRCYDNTIVEAVELAGTASHSDFASQSKQLESEAERRFWKAFLDDPQPALRGLVPQHAVGRYRLDFAIPEQQVAIEIDGYAYHSSKEAFENDRLRERALEHLRGFGMEVDEIAARLRVAPSSVRTAVHRRERREAS